MDSSRPVLIPLDAVEARHEAIVGGKAAKLSQLARAGFTVPRGVCLTTWAYESFIGDSDIVNTIRMELGRKSLDEMRWEEIWDAALRIRAAFMVAAALRFAAEDHRRESERFRFLHPARSSLVRDW